jgi:hypothetical protein
MTWHITNVASPEGHRNLISRDFIRQPKSFQKNNFNNIFIIAKLNFNLSTVSDIRILPHIIIGTVWRKHM